LWLRQRSRWFKGWLQTWAVHMRAPVRLWRELGPAGFMAFQLVVGGNVLAALVHPFFLAWLFYRLTLGPGFSTAGEPDGGVLTVFYGVAFFAGYVVSITFGFVGLARRGLWKSTWALAFVVPHWMLLSVAAWRALFHLAWNPYGWEKTTHGLGKSSRRARLNSSATLTALFRNESAAPATERSSVPSNATPGNGLLRSEPSLPAQTRQAAA
jgi:hypothetical protein